MKKLVILLTLLVASCATVDYSILDKQQKLLARKYTDKGNHYFQFYDGTVLVVDGKTYHDFREQQVVQLTWRKK